MVRGEGAYVCDSRGNRYLDGLSGLFTSQLGHGRRDLAEAAARQASQLGYFPLWTYAHPPAIELAEKLAQARPRGPQPRVLHDGRLRGRRVRVEARAPVPPPARATTTATRSSAATSPTTARRWGRSRSRSVIPYRTPFEPLVPGAIKVPNTNFYRAREHADDPTAFSAVVRRPDRGGDPARGPRDRRRGLPRARAERGRVLHAAAGLLRAGPRDLRPLRRAVRLRRGHLRVRAARHVVRRPEVRLRPRHDHLREGHDERVRAARRAHRERPRRRALLRGRPHVPARHHVRGPPGELRGRAQEHRVVRDRADPRARDAACEGYLHDAARDAARAARSWATCAGTGFFWGIELVQRPGDEGDLRGRRGRAAAARVRLARAVPARAHLPLRRPRRPRRPGRPAAHLRAATSSTSSSARCARCSPRPSSQALAAWAPPTRRCGGRRSPEPPAGPRRRSTVTSTSTSPSSGRASRGCGPRSPRCATTRPCASCVLERRRRRRRRVGAQRRAGRRRCTRSPFARVARRVAAATRRCALRAHAPRGGRRARATRRAPRGIEFDYHRGGTVTLARSELQADAARATSSTSCAPSATPSDDATGSTRARRAARCDASGGPRGAVHAALRRGAPRQARRRARPRRRAPGRRRSTSARRSPRSSRRRGGGAPSGGDRVRHRARRRRRPGDRGVHAEAPRRAARRGARCTRSSSRPSRSTRRSSTASGSRSARRSATTGTSSSTGSAPPTTGSSSAGAARRTTSARASTPASTTSPRCSRSSPRRSTSCSAPLPGGDHPPLGRAARGRAGLRAVRAARPRGGHRGGRRVRRRRRRAQPRRGPHARGPHRGRDDRAHDAARSSGTARGAGSPSPCGGSGSTAACCAAGLADRREARDGPAPRGPRRSSSASAGG